MKKLSIILFALITGSSVMAQTQSMGNSNVNADFTRYKSFTWVHARGNIASKETPEEHSVIENAIFNELEGRGYRETPGTGDLIVIYQVLEKKGKIHGYNNDYPAITIAGKQIRQPSDTATFNVVPGTMVVNLIDAKTDETVWTGFSSGVIRDKPEESAPGPDEMQLREAVHSIFERFKYEADNSLAN